MTIYDKVNEVVSPVYQVGGSVRDKLLGLEPKDYDFATPLSPEEVENAIKKVGKKCYAIGTKFGTLGMKIDGELVEITTFRTEKYSFNSRKPRVRFVNDLSADLGRRDFTINAIAQQNDTLIDPYSGQFDIMSKTLKCVGDAKDRFKEDPLRMLRAGRFASQLGFEIDQHLEATTKNLKLRFYNEKRINRS